MRNRALRLFGVLTVLAATPADAKTCEDFQRDMATAYTANKLELAVDLARQASQFCQGAAMDIIGRSAALLHVRRAADAMTTPAARKELVEVGLKLGRTWQLVAAAGDIAHGEKRHTDAARFYQEALDDIRNERLNPTPPKIEVIGALVRKAEASSLLSKVHVTRVDRSGAPGGLACPTVRGYTVMRTAVPIEFEYNEPGDKRRGADAFTEKGRTAAEDLLSLLTKQATPSIHLIGHTDPVGGDAYNIELSRRRAEAVAGFLKTRGYAGEVRTSGIGRQRPFVVDDPGSYGEPERHQMDRRVELERSGGTSCAPPSG
jgi:OmpA-OmpF porin, OOP family